MNQNELPKSGTACIKHLSAVFKSLSKRRLKSQNEIPEKCTFPFHCSREIRGANRRKETESAEQT